ncbi:MAG: copper resistance protein B [Parvularculaceae bacterium]
MSRSLIISLLIGIAAAGGAEAQIAADAYYDPQDMATARHMLRMHHGDANVYYVEGDRFEYQTGEGDPLFLWDAQGFWGGDLNKLWIKSEGELRFDIGEVEDAELQALWSRAIGGYFDLQAGMRHDFAGGPDRNYAVFGVQGLAPYLFEIDAAAFVSGHGDVTARIEVEYELLFTQRLILQPRTELNFAAQDVAALAIGSGLSSAELGARLRYEIRRDFAPYIGIAWTRDVGRTADITRSMGAKPGDFSFVAGVRFWF